MRSTAQLTRELRRLAQRKGLFNDPGAQIGELAPTVRANIKSMEQQLGSFATGVGQYPLGVSARMGTAGAAGGVTCCAFPRFAAKRSWALEWGAGDYEGASDAKRTSTAVGTENAVTSTRGSVKP